MKRTVKEPVKELLPEEKIHVLLKERDVLRNETDDTNASLERIEHINKEIELLKNKIADAKDAQVFNFPVTTT